MLIGSKFNLTVKPIDIKGLGVFTEDFIKKDSIIEVCHIIEHFSRHDDALKYYNFTDKNERLFIPLGLGCIYNHSNEPNIKFDVIYKDKVIIFTSLKDINIDEELCHNYGYTLEGWIWIK